MSSTTSQATPQSESLARLLSSISTALLVVFLAAVVSAALPPRLLDPGWQLKLTSALINNGLVALVGFLLLPLAAWIDAANPSLRARTLAFRRWSFAAALGFLLLAPLQGVAAWQTQRNANLNQAWQNRQFSRQLAEMRGHINAASSTSDLQARLKGMQGPPGWNAQLSPAELSTPMPQLKPQLLAELQQGEGKLRQLMNGAAAVPPGPLLKESLRIAASALAYAYAFAAAAGVLGRRPPSGFSPTDHLADGDYFQLLAAEKD